MSDIFAALCDLADDFTRLCPEVQPDAARCMLEALVDRLDGMIDHICEIRLVERAEETDSPCKM